MEGTGDSSKLKGMMSELDVFLTSRSHYSHDSRDISGFYMDSSTKTSSLRDAASECEQKAEILAAKNQITMLKRKLSSLETTRKKARYDHERDMETLQQDVKRMTGTCETLKDENHSLLKKLEDSQKQVKETRSEMQKIKAVCEERVLAAQGETLKLQDRLHEVLHDSQNKLMELKNTNLEQLRELMTCRSEMEEAKSRLEQAARSSSEAQESRKENEEYKIKLLQAEQKIKSLEEQLHRLDDDQVVTKVMKSKLSSYPEMERENRKLRDENKYHRDTAENNMLLKEETEGLRQKVKRLERELADYSQLQIEHQETKSQLEKWQACFGSQGNVSQNPESLSRSVSQLQSAQAILLEKQGHLQASAHILEQSLHQKEEEEQAARGQVMKLEQKSQQQADLIKKLQKKLLLMTKERDAFKNVLDSYEDEMTVNLSKPAVAAPQAIMAKEMESLVTSIKRQNAQLEKDLEKARSEVTAQTVKIRQLESQLEKAQNKLKDPPAPLTSTLQADSKIILTLREQVTGLEKQVEKLQEENGILEARIEQRHLQGDYDPTKTKVLHLVMNPASLARERRAKEVEELRAETEKLRERVKLLEEGGAEVQNLTLTVEKNLQQPSTSKEVEDIKAQLESAELKNQRYVEAFKKTSREFREVCYELTGYRIDMPTSNQYKLMNIYAASAQEYLLFKRSSNGEMQVLETEYSKTLTDLMDTYLKDANSIPAFLNSLTIQLFNQQTMAM